MLDIALLPGEYAVCALPPGTAVPLGASDGLAGGEVVSLTWTTEGGSLICPTHRVPEGIPVESAWRCLRVVVGPLNLNPSGILASLVGPLADARVTTVALSAYDTDYILVPAVRLDEAAATLRQAGHRLTD